MPYEEDLGGDSRPQGGGGTSIAEEIGVQEVSFDEVLATDFVSLHLPLTEQTHRLIDAEAFRKFKPSGILINVARGGIVDTPALVDGLNSSQLAGAGLDVVTPYPLPTEHPLWGMRQVIITPHVAGYSFEALEASFRFALDDAIRVLNGFRPDHPVPEHSALANSFPEAPTGFLDLP